MSAWQPDILHAHHIPGPGWLGALTGYHPFIVSTWGSDVLIEPHRSTIRRRMVEYVLNRADRVTAPSRLLYEALVGLDVGEERLVLIPWGIDTNVFAPTPKDRLATRRQLDIDENAWVVFSPRAISPLYEQHTVIDAIERLSRSIPGLELVMLRYHVEPDYLEKLEEQIRTAGLTTKVHWLPAANSRVEMARLYRAADVTVSIPASEGYGITVYEALACGCPTVVSDLPAFTRDLEDGVHVLKAPVGDSTKLADALLTLHSLPELYGSLKVNGLSYARGLDVSRRFALSKRLYAEILNS